MVSGTECGKMRVLHWRGDRDGTCRGAVSVTQCEGELVNVVYLELILVHQNVVMCGP